ncbi:MAG: membrane integrity-associated transporter subunit PqiC [Gammaproteobacteria bacterium]|nr:membrane integrity-associated transporter subunit PqiC [Gammaproteobacteria bacterium]
MRRSAIITLILAVLAACGGQSTVEEDHYYRLTGPQVAPPSRPLTDGTIFVEQFLADGIQRERALVYADSPATTELRQRHYHFWADSPSRLLRDQLVDYLRAASAGSRITDAPEVPADLSIYGKIRRLEQVLKSGSADVVVVLEFRVQKAGADAPVLLRQYERTQPAGNASVEAAVHAFAAALSEIYGQLVEDIAGA